MNKNDVKLNSITSTDWLIVWVTAGAYKVANFIIIYCKNFIQAKILLRFFGGLF